MRPRKSQKNAAGAPEIGSLGPARVPWLEPVEAVEAETELPCDRCDLPTRRFFLLVYVLTGVKLLLCGRCWRDKQIAYGLILPSTLPSTRSGT